MSDDLQQQALAIAAKLSVEQCVSLLSGRDFWTTRDIAGAVPSVMMCDGPHGLRKQAEESDHLGLSNSVPATGFPVAAVLASSWDRDLARSIGEALGRESLAEDIALLLGPGVNMKRHPRGGRNFEYYSEDPVLAGHMGVALIEGVKSTGVGSCVKHFAANNQETNRMIVDEIIDERTLREVYLRAFEIVVQESKPAAVMTAYNRINGVYCSDSQWLIDGVLRGEWGFRGMVVSDWGGTNDRVAAIRAGMDLEMPGNGGAFNAEIMAALETGNLSEAELRACAVRVVELALRGDALRARPVTVVDFDAHNELARRAAAAGAVLLTNDGTLPLNDTKGVGLIGAFAETPRYQGAGSSQVNAIRVSTLRESLDPDIPFAPGYDAVTGDATPELLAEAVALATRMDRVVLIVGTSARAEAESRDRDGVRLSAVMERLIAAVCDANPRTVVVCVNGGALEMPWVDRAAAVLEAYLGGQAGGQALADVLLGKVEPGGRLAESLPMSCAELPSDANFPGAPRQVQYREGQWIGYRFHDTFAVPARFPFGHGLGYTTWSLAGLEVTGGGVARQARVSVTNTGSRAGSTVVQIYVRDVESTLQRPAKELAGFARVTLAPGETKDIEVAIERRIFSVWDVVAGRWMVEAGQFEVLAGTSSVNIACSAVIDVASPDVVNSRPAAAGPVATDAEFAALLGWAIPKAEQIRPFTRISTVAELETSRLGGLLGSVIRKQMEKMIPPDDDGSMREFLGDVIAGLPMRGMAAMGSGLTLPMLDRILAVLNGQFLKAIRGR